LACPKGTKMSTAAHTTTTAVPRTAASPAVAGAVAVSALALVLALAGPGWLYVAANPAAKTPAMTLDFAGLRKLTDTPGIPTNWVQSAFFGWLAWVLVIVALLLAAAYATTRLRLAATATAVVALVALIVDVLALKGVGTWNQLLDQIPNVRLGGYLMVVGLVLILATGVLGSKASRS
jgi:hypothetical protein